MFGKQANKEPEKPRLQGEDFDIFPDLGDRYTYGSEGGKDPEDAPEDDTAEPAPPPEPTGFEKRVAAFSPSAWKKLQIGGGAVLGLLAGLSLTVLSEYKTFSGYGLIVAVVLALLVPNIIERQAKRSITAGRISMIAVLALTLIVYFVYGFINPPAE